MFGLDVDMKIDMPDPSHLNQFYLKVSIDKEIGLTINAKIGAKFSTGIPIAPPIKVPVLVGVIPLTFNIEPTLAGNLYFGDTLTGSISLKESNYAAVICNNDCFNQNNWQVEGSKSLTPNLSNISGNGEASIKLGPKLSVNARICDIIGPFFRLFAGGKAQVTTPLDHLPYTLSAFIEGAAGIDAGIDAWFARVTFFSIETNLFNYEYKIKEGVILNQLPQISSFTITPQNPGTGNNVTIQCNAIDSDNDTLTYNWSVASGTISGSGSQITWTAPNTPGTYTINVTVSDGYGGSFLGSINVVTVAGGGVKLWTRQLGTAVWDEGLGVATDGSGNIYVTGGTDVGLDGNTNAGKVDVFLTKFSP